jgi:hypothetical protein
MAVITYTPETEARTAQILHEEDAIAVKIIDSGK